MIKTEPLIPGSIYHIYNHANGSDNLFREERNYDYFLLKYQKHISSVAETFAYCLLPNHFHLLLKIRSEEELILLPNHQGFLNSLDHRGFKNSLDHRGFKNSLDHRGFKNSLDHRGFKNLDDLEGFLSKQFSNFFNSYSKSINKAYNRMGSLFIPRFKRKLITSDNHFRETFLYIHTNPVKHGFTANEADWPHSSLHFYKENQAPGFLNTAFAVEKFDNLSNLIHCQKEKRNKILSINDEFD